MHALTKLLLLQLLTSLGRQVLGTEIINGKKVRTNSMLFMASVQNHKGHVCGGFLISEDFVMTAAHCDNANPVSVILGTHNLKNINNNTMRYGIQKCKHPMYKKAALGNDIMLLKLSRKAFVGKNKQIKPVQLPSRQVNPKADKTCSVAGWGWTKTNGKTEKELRVAKVRMVDLNKCQEMWSNRLPSNVFCAGGYKSTTGFCQGDSGGPLVCGKNQAVGVVSFNYAHNCDYPNAPNVYTDVSKFLPWIKDILKKKKC